MLDISQIIIDNAYGIIYNEIKDSAVTEKTEITCYHFEHRSKALA